MSDIPPEIVAEFLSRVPAKSLLRFRCVSKSWRALIDDPDFIRTHLNTTVLSNSDRKLILRSRNLYSADFDVVEKTNKADYKELDHPLKCPGKVTEVLGSCNGLLCLYNGHDNIVIWNPTTRKHLKLPYSEFVFPECNRAVIYGFGYADGDGNFSQYEFQEPSYWVTYGFGYDKVSDDYKVLRILQSIDADTEVKVFSMKSTSWRKIPGFPFCLKKYKKTDGVLAGGALHWVVNRKPESPGSAIDPEMEMETLIAAFDLGTEEYRLVPQPDYSEKKFPLQVDVLGEFLCVVCDYYETEYLDIWVMKKYGVEESWTKLFRVANGHDCVTPVGYSESGRQVFMVQNDKLFVCYDLENRKVKHSKLGISSECCIMEHHMCFGSLVQVGGVSGHGGKVPDRKEERGAKRKSNKKRGGFLSEGFKLVL